jgi:hypothetical protein
VLLLALARQCPENSVIRDADAALSVSRSVSVREKNPSHDTTGCPEALSAKAI